MEVETRQLGLLQRIHDFCRKGGYPITTSDPMTLMKYRVQNMALQNALHKRTDKEHNYIKVSVSFLGEHIVTGLFTPDEIKGLSDIGNEVRLE